MTSGKIFINYRREDAKPWSLLLYKALAPTFGPERIFYDVDTIPAGADFVAFLNAQVAEADVLLALIGDKWLEATNPETGRRRLDDPADFVRIEIAAALADPAVRVIPVMLDQTPIPSEAALPAPLAPLTRRNAVRLTHERFDADMGGLTRALQTALTEAEQRRADATARDRRQAEARAAEEAAAARRAAREEHLAGLSPEEVAKAEEMANWQYIQAKDDPDLFRDHLARFPTGASSPWATEKLETLAWARLDAGAPDEAALDAFLSDFPTGAHAAAARARRDALRAEAAAEQEAARRLAEAETAWGAVKDSADPATLRAFAAQHPDSPHAAEAARLARALSRGGWTRRAALVGVGTVGLGGAVAAYENRRWIRAWALDSSLRTLRGHTSVVDSVAIAPDGTRALSGAWDRTLILWDLATGQPLRTFEGHTASIFSVAITPDGTRALSGAQDNTLRLWDLATGQALRSFDGHTNWVFSVALTPDGTRALSGAGDRTLILWDLATGQALRAFKGHTNTVLSVALTPDGTRALSGSGDRTLILWDLASGQALRTFEGHTGSVFSVAVTPDGARALSGSEDRTLKLWDLATGQPLRSFDGHTDMVLSVALTPDGTRALSGSLDRTLKLWDLASGRTLRTLEGHTLPVSSVAITPDGTRALSGSYDNTVRVWDITG